MAVTPVRTLSPSTIVVCPTRTSATSVMALSGPGEKTPGAMPTSRARDRVCAASAITERAATRAVELWRGGIAFSSAIARLEPRDALS